jgi:membrane-associated PAP2 superfamily phosphatase
MNRTGLIVALLVGVAAGLVFGLFPGLDLAVARLFSDVPNPAGFTFAWRFSPVLLRAHDVALNAPFVVVVAAVLALALKLVLPRRRMLLRPRAAIFLIVTMLLGPGLLVNVALKDHWGRPRPVDVTEFRGEQHFVAWWDPRGDCPDNCSFVSGDVSTVAWTFAPAALLLPPWQAIAFGGVFVLTAFMAAVRMMAGGHFPSDVIFAALFTYLLIWLCYALIFRWPATRLDDKRIEAALEDFVHRCRAGLGRLFRRGASSALTDRDAPRR